MTWLTQPMRSHREVAKLMTARGFKMGRNAVFETEKRALRKLRENPELQALVRELTAASDNAPSAVND